MIEQEDEAPSGVAKDIEEVCLRLLSRREHSQKELLDKLALRGFDRADVQPVLDELARQGWQDDLRYAESYARFRIQKGYGAIRVSYELKQNGIAALDLDAIAQEEAGSWMALIEQVYRKKYTDEVVLERNEWAKRSRFLLHRGFSGAMISTLFDELNIRFSK
ncbi:MAG: regulatory protein RecX [Methylobacter sp.]|nr:regulatory protein RecX [Methylobacter sp.]MDP2098986.1 regulatory protein RecX [Methylobacter sp.]MDP2427531.1 regulatory protein RecX [Methylobacter sp.]MDP3056816.1 regulatory protein RecX [Methylobacter sp.]MDP3364035.1 regulatory protein RecX [Methylobacter sp.]